MATLGTFVAGQVLTASELNAIGTWTSFTPVWTNLTVGNGTVSGKYCQINDIAFVRVFFSFGSTSAITGLITINHPVGTSAGDFVQAGNARINDAGTATYSGVINVRTSIAEVLALNANTFWLSTASTANNIPMTWATGDLLHFQYFYEVA